VEALRREREQGDAGAGIRALTEQLTSGDFAAQMKAAGVEVTDAVDAVANGGAKLDGLLLDLQSKSMDYKLKVRAGKEPGNPEYAQRWDEAAKALKGAHGRWSKALKDEAAIAAQMEIINAKVLKAKVGTAEAWSLDFLVPTGDDGLPEYTDDMKAMAQALGAIVDPAKAWQEAQDKVAKSNKNAKASLSDYLKVLRDQLKAQRGFQGNLTKLALAGYGDLTDHFARARRKSPTSCSRSSESRRTGPSRRSGRAWRSCLRSPPATARRSRGTSQRPLRPTTRANSGRSWRTWPSPT
jgi:hypothetical protein